MKFLTVFDGRNHVAASRHLHEHLYSIPRERTIIRAAEVLKRGHKLRKILHDVAMCLLFASFMFVITNEQRQKLSFVLNKSLVDTFVHVKYARNITFDEVCNLYNVM